MQIQSLIDGQWVDGAAGLTDNINPSDLSDTVSRSQQIDQATIKTAIDAAELASREWGVASPEQRSLALAAIATGITNQQAELGELLAREEGKTLGEAIGEVGRAAAIFRFFSGEALRLQGQCGASVRPGVDVEVTREPVGVVAAITPFNFPIAIPAWKVAPALAYGNAVLLKPAQSVSATAYRLAQIINDSPLPDGVFNLILSSGADFGRAIEASEHIGAISFTGSQEVGRGIAVKAVTAGQRVQLEMGGKNPLVVLDDADLDVAVNTAIQGAFYSTGQRCTASSRIIVTEGIHDRFVSAMKEKMDALVVGPALDPKTQIGPVIDERQLATNRRYVDIAREEGAIVHGGEEVECDTQGHFMRPALLIGATNDMRSSREEIFGPVASVIEVADFEAALETANDTEFGLSAGICTSSLAHARKFKLESKAGMVMINLPTAGVDYHVPFGGRKGSSYGPREQGENAREFYTIVKTAYTWAY